MTLYNQYIWIYKCKELFVVSILQLYHFTCINKKLFSGNLVSFQSKCIQIKNGFICAKDIYTKPLVVHNWIPSVVFDLRSFPFDCQPFSDRSLVPETEFTTLFDKTCHDALVYAPSTYPLLRFLADGWFRHAQPEYKRSDFVETVSEVQLLRPCQF